MSRSLKRVIAALRAAGLDAEPVEMGETRTAQQAADAVGSALDQIAKSILFATSDGGYALFLTAGGSRVDGARSATLAGVPLTRADADTVRAVTGFAIGGVSPVGHLYPSPVWMDRRLTEFEPIWAAAATPRHVFPISPEELLRVTGATLADYT